MRVLRLRDGRRSGFMIVNEGSTAVATRARFPLRGAPTLWDPATGAVTPATTYRDDADGTELALSLQPHEVLGVTFETRSGHGRHDADSGPHAVAVSPGATVESFDADRRGLRASVLATRPGPLTLVARDGGRAYRGSVTIADPLTPIALDGAWRLQVEASGGATADRPLGSWTDLAPTHSGSASYTRSLQLTSAQLAGREWTLDLGDVRTAAEVTINGRALPQPLLWAPYVADVGGLLRAGTNEIAVRVTNTGANSHGDVRASGLLGPVRLLPQRRLTIALSRADGDALLELQPSVESLDVAPGQQRTLSVAVRDLTGRSGRVRLSADVSGPLQLRDRSVDVRLGRDGTEQRAADGVGPLDAAVPAAGELRLRAGGATATVPVRGRARVALRAHVPPRRRRRGTPGS